MKYSLYRNGSLFVPYENEYNSFRVCFFFYLHSWLHKEEANSDFSFLVLGQAFLEKRAQSWAVNGNLLELCVFTQELGIFFPLGWKTCVFSLSLCLCFCLCLSSPLPPPSLPPSLFLLKCCYIDPSSRSIGSINWLDRSTSSYHTSENTCLFFPWGEKLQ